MKDARAQRLWAGDQPAWDAVGAAVAAMPQPMDAAGASPDAETAALVAVILHAQDDRATLAAVARSVLAQGWRDLMLVLIDDAAGNDVAAIVDDLARLDQRVVVIAHPLPLGRTRAIDHALSQIFATQYAILPADCWMHPDHVAVALEQLAADSEAKACLPGCVLIDGEAVGAPQAEPGAAVFPRSSIAAAGEEDGVQDIVTRLVARHGDAALCRAMRPTLVRRAPEPGADTLSSQDRAAARAQDEPIDLFNDAGSADGARHPGEPLVVRWPDKGKGGANWGDKLNRVLVHALSGCAVINASNHPGRPAGAPVHFVIGSGLAGARDDAIVWGSGFISADQTLQCPVDRIHAVRGPLSRERVVAAGGSPALPLGDPALLLPLFYDPGIAPRFDIGIIAHFRDAGQDPLPSLPPGLSRRIIDITGGLAEVIDAILSCRMLLSSSLHGLIMAHAYGRAAAWIKFSDRPLGDDFKFRDYWASIGRPDYRPHDVRADPAIDPAALVATPHAPLVDLGALIGACPFISDARKTQLLARAAILRAGASLFSQDAGALRGHGDHRGAIA